MNDKTVNEIIIFTPKDGDSEFKIVLDESQDTVWATEQQIINLFGKARRTISEHIKNIYKEGELDKKATWREFRQVQKEGDREVSRNVSSYNLDVIISIGYRVKSKTGIEFRKWATSKLKEHLIKGYTINQNILETNQSKILELERSLREMQKQAIDAQQNLTKGFLSIIEEYSKSFELLSKFDNDELNTDGLNKDFIYVINYKDAREAIQELKQNLILKSEASEIFGNEKDKSFEGILGSISQTVFGELAYPTIEEQAAQLLYSTIKGHAFSDGNKRIGSFLFVWFLELNNFHFNIKGKRKINEITLTALALAVAQSLPEQREIIVKLIINMIKNS